MILKPVSVLLTDIDTKCH